MRNKVFLFIVFLIMVALDQLSKEAVRASFNLYESKEVIAGLFNITYVMNPGAAFGIFNDKSELFRQILFIGLTIVACILIVYMITKEYEYKMRTFGYTMVLAGAVGNMIDRIRFGTVVDFLDFYHKSWHWYTFNIADCCITAGVALVVIDVLFFNRKVL